MKLILLLLLGPISPIALVEAKIVRFWVAITHCRFHHQHCLGLANLRRNEWLLKLLWLHSFSRHLLRMLILLIQFLLLMILHYQLLSLSHAAALVGASHRLWRRLHHRNSGTRLQYSIVIVINRLGLWQLQNLSLSHTLLSLSFISLRFSDDVGEDNVGCSLTRDCVFLLLIFFVNLKHVQLVAQLKLALYDWRHHALRLLCFYRLEWGFTCLWWASVTTRVRITTAAALRHFARLS